MRSGWLWKGEHFSDMTTNALKDLASQARHSQAWILLDVVNQELEDRERKIEARRKGNPVPR